MVVFFVLLLLMVQVGFLVASRSMAVSAVEASARRVAAGSPASGEEVRLVTELETSIPGAVVRSVGVTVSEASAEVAATVEWTPPGPDLVPVTFDLRATRVVAIPP